LRKAERAIRRAESLRGDRERDRLRHENARLRRLVDAQSEALEAARRQRRIALPIPRKGRKSKLFIRAIIPDTHGAAWERRAVAAMLADLEHLQPAEIVLLGDHVDCGGFLAQHHTLGYVAQTEYTYAEDLECAGELLDRLRAVSPHAEIHYIEGNHERRVETFCVTATLRNTRDAEFMRRTMHPEYQLRLADRGIKYYRQDRHYFGLPVQGTIRLGQCHFTHGVSSAKHAATVHLQKFGGCVVFGHTHRAEGVVGWKVGAADIGAWCPGCLSVKQPLWRHTNPTDWTHGYAIQIVEAASGDFLHINVPIVRGRSLFVSMAGLIGKTKM
jgi:predicted phosphodiesterase